ncbi:unnamed protein product [Triticum turgidum subsp. durum]|uniref:Uncharacterized protein n=1 Tax=Triticum turgidum subsp. durum TaxID=4567 RepID=A0A9R1PTW3_TRITD|nr:unnamed protein product [Triticum turgidum subsp. durum]
MRKVYDAFLAEFPLCFGYWKKYADHEGCLDGVNKVFEIMVPKHCGMSSTSSMKNHFQAWSHLAVVYTRILEHPIQRLDWYFNWKQMRHSHSQLFMGTQTFRTNQ